MHKDTSRSLDFLMKTYGNGDMVSTQLLQSLGTLYTTKAATYLSKRPSRPFVGNLEFFNEHFPPTGAQLRQRYVESEYSQLQAYGYSNYERHKRECQSVAVSEGEHMAVDHTFQTLKSYFKKDNMKAMFTGIKMPSKEVLFITGVPSTSLKDAAHCLQQSRDKRGMKPSVISTDTMPHGIQFWKELYGEDVHCQLGLFHLMMRITDELDPKCKLYWCCLVELKSCIYEYDEKLLDKLTAALKAGTVSRDGHKYTDDEIYEMRHSKKWKQRYDRFLKKMLYGTKMIRTKLEYWIERWEGEVDKWGKAIFTNKTADATREQFGKLEFALDCEAEIQYEEIPAPAGSKHGLSTFKSNRPESALEKFHELLAHYSNAGCGDEMADVLLQRGWAEHNVVARHRQMCQKKRQILQSTQLKKMDKTPIFMDHSMMHFINQQSQEMGFVKLFEECRIPTEDNGEVFLKNYHLDQVRRNEAGEFDNDSKFCTCAKCKGMEEVGEDPRLSTQHDDATIPDCDPLEPQPALTITVSPTPKPLKQNILAMHRRCKPDAPYYCATMLQYMTKKSNGVSVRGKPPHCFQCVYSSMYYNWAPTY